MSVQLRRFRNTAGAASEMIEEIINSKRTLQEWERGRRQPTGTARNLLKIAKRHPEVLRELAETP